MGDRFPLGTTRVFLMGKGIDIPIQGELRCVETFAVKDNPLLNPCYSSVMTVTLTVPAEKIKDIIRELIETRRIGLKRKTTYRSIRRNCAKRNKYR